MRPPLPAGPAPQEPAQARVSPFLGCPLADLLARISAGGSVRGQSLTLPPWASEPTTLASLNQAQLAATLGIRPLGARRLALAFALYRQLLTRKESSPPFCRTPEEVMAVMRPLALIDHERFWCLPLDTHCRLLGEPIEVTRGDVDGTEAGPRAVCRAALRAGAHSMIAVHNHPSGVVAPSHADIAVTRLLAAAGRTIEVALTDHLIITAGGSWLSLRRERPEAFK